MPGRWSMTCAVTVIVSVGAAAAQQVFRSEANLTHFGVTVVDKRGAIVSTLTADDFEIVEDGAPQVITHFARGVEGHAPDLHAGIMLDTSESMAADRDLSHSAAIKFLNRLPEAKDLTLVDFDSEIRLGRFSQDQFPRLVERIRNRKVEGMTALYDAFIIYLERALDNSGRSVLVALTDGGDSRSTSRFADVVDGVRASTNVTIYVIGLVENQLSDMRSELRVRLSRIAEESGGRAVFPYSMKQIEEAYDQIAAELRSQYSLGYVSSNTRRDGRWRKVKIRITRPDLKDLRVRTREGYFGPYSPSPR